jgi:hypothetical protein
MKLQPIQTHPIGRLDNLTLGTGIIGLHGLACTVWRINNHQDLDRTVRRITSGQGSQYSANVRLIEARDDDRQTEVRRWFSVNLKWVQLTPFQILIDRGSASPDRHS